METMRTMRLLSDTRSDTEIKEDPIAVSKMELICKELRAAGYDPTTQIAGYLLTDRDNYITRSGGARDLICTLDKTQINRYYKKYLRK